MLLLLDGELSPPEAEAVGIHLDRCGECQAKMQGLQKGLRALAEYRQAAFRVELGAPPKGWSEFSAMLDRISTAGE